MLTKYIILESSQIPLETLLFSSCKYDFKFKLGSKMSPKHLTIKVNVKKQRRFDRSTVIFKLKSKNFCMRLNIQSIIKMLMRY